MKSLDPLFRLMDTALRMKSSGTISLVDAHREAMHANMIPCFFTQNQQTIASMPNALANDVAHTSAAAAIAMDFIVMSSFKM